MNDHTISAQVSGVFGDGLPPAPESTDPIPWAATSSGVMLYFSTCVIWPIFSASVSCSSRRSRSGIETLDCRLTTGQPHVAGRQHANGRP